MATIEVDTDAERDGWAVFTLEGSFRTAPAVELLGRALLDALLDGYPVVAIDVSQASGLAPGVLGTFVSAADLYGRCDGLVIVSGLDVLDAAALRRIDNAHGVNFLCDR